MLHTKQQFATLLHICAPPLAQGLMWSTVANKGLKVSRLSKLVCTPRCDYHNGLSTTGYKWLGRSRFTRSNRNAECNNN